jgi:hypothetical protein
MERRTAIAVVALSNIILVVSWFMIAGGVAGIVKDPLVQLSALAVMVLICAPISWLTYRRMLRNPIAVAAGTASPEAVARMGLDHAPAAFAAERWKVLISTLYILAIAAIFATVGLLQPGVCRTASLAATVALFGWPIVSWAASLFVLPALTISRDGLTYANAWRSRTWAWDEIRDIKVSKPNLRFLGRLSEGVYFRRYQPPDHLEGPARAGFRAMWAMSGDELGALLNTARERWSTPLGASFVPVPTRWRAYVPMVIRMGVIAGMLWLWYAQPCGRH